MKFVLNIRPETGLEAKDVGPASIQKDIIILGQGLDLRNALYYF